MKDILWLILVIIGLTIFGAMVRADEILKPAYKIRGDWAIQVLVPDPVSGKLWKTESHGQIDGGAFIQFRSYSSSIVTGCSVKLSSDNTCKRLVLHVQKPLDKAGSLAIQFPGRTKAITLLKNQPYGELILNEMSSDDFGLASLRLNIEGATSSDYGILNINAHEDDRQDSARPSMTIRGREIQDGSLVKAGWFFLFFGSAKKLEVFAVPTDLLSFCGFYPNGSYSCVNDSSIDLRIRKKGNYFFVAWTKNLRFSSVMIKGV